MPLDSRFTLGLEDLTRFANVALGTVLVVQAAPGEAYERTCDRVYALISLFADLPKDPPEGWTAHQRAQLRRTQDKLRRTVPRLVDLYVEGLARYHEENAKDLRGRTQRRRS